jgi:hypothetical protein
MQVAPVAKLDDGRFDRVIIEADATIADLTIAAIQATFVRAPRSPDHGRRLHLKTELGRRWPMTKHRRVVAFEVHGSKKW